jgi:hypothetical protein
MTNTFLISETKLREFTDIANNVDSALIKNAIRESQDIGLQRIIGTLLYDKIMDLVDANTIGDSANSAYKTLLDDYIQDFLIYAAYYYALDSIYIRSRNDGLIRPTGGENSEPVERTIYNMKRQSVQNKMEYYAERLTNYIIEEENSYPELNESNKLYEQVPNYDSKYRAGFVFSKDLTAQEFIKRGYRVYDTRYKQYPQ